MTKHEALASADLRCTRCGAEHNRTILRYLYDSPTVWCLAPPGAPLGLRYARLVQIEAYPKLPPADPEEWDVLCQRCWIVRDVEAVYKRPKPHRRREKAARLVT